LPEFIDPDELPSGEFAFETPTSEREHMNAVVLK